jgi:hypothetical protein
MKKILLILGFLFFLNCYSYSQVAVIANKSVSSSKVSTSALGDLYELDNTDLGGTKVKLFDINGDSPIKDKFYKSLGKSTSDIKKVWMKKKLTGNGNPPSGVSSEDDMLSKVASTPGAIGYISTSKVNSSVKVLLELK